MKLLFVAGTAPLSKLIMWGLDEPCSHFAILFDDKIVFHADLTGVHIAWYEHFAKTHSIVHELDFSDASLDLQEEAYQAIISQYYGKMYDFGSFVYFFWRAALKKVFKVAMPLRSPWGSKKTFLCTEIAGVMPDEVVPAEIKSSRDLGMTSPYQLWLLLSPRAK